MDRDTFLGEIADITPVAGLLDEAYRKQEEDIWLENTGNEPHGYPWHTSFHSSEFPDEDKEVCGRALVYGLMNPAPEKPLDPFLREWFAFGLDMEHRWVNAFDSFGILLSANVTAEAKFQTNFQDKVVWMSGSPDAIILPRWHKKSHVVEIKSTSLEKIIAMQADRTLVPNSHAKYVRQIKVYIAEAHEKFSPMVAICRKSGTIIKDDKCNHKHDGECDFVMIRVEPPNSGTIIYAPRDMPAESPLATVSYYVGYDPEFVTHGKEKLYTLKRVFEEDKIPEHVHEGESSKWSVGACQWCRHKKPYCKQDYKEKTTKLSESALVKFTKSIRPNYDPVATRQLVLDRWKE